MTSPTLLLVLVLTSQTKTAGSSWVQAVSKDGRFTFAMPAAPIEKIVTQQSKNGPIEILEYSCTHDGCLYKIEKTKVPVAIADDKLEQALAGARDSIARKNKLLADKATTVAGWPARELVIEASLRPGAAASTIAMLICYVDGEFCQVRVFSTKPGAVPKDARKFFDAFKPKKVRANAEAKKKS